MGAQRQKGETLGLLLEIFLSLGLRGVCYFKGGIELHLKLGPRGRGFGGLRRLSWTGGGGGGVWGFGGGGGGGCGFVGEGRGEGGVFGGGGLLGVWWGGGGVGIPVEEWFALGVTFCVKNKSAHRYFGRLMAFGEV